MKRLAKNRMPDRLDHVLIGREHHVAVIFRQVTTGHRQAVAVQQPTIASRAWQQSPMLRDAASFKPPAAPSSQWPLSSAVGSIAR